MAMIRRWWKLVILFSSFMIETITFGITGSTGIYNIEFLEHFNVGIADVSWIGSLNMAMYMGTGPIVSMLLKWMSLRRVALLGSLISTGSLISIPFLNDIIYLYLVYGVVQGFGMAMVFMPSNIIVGLYFNKHRSLASGILMCGSGLGGVVFPLLVQTLIEYYGWKGSFFMLAGIMLQCVAFAATLSPLQNNNQSLLSEHELLKMNRNSLVKKSSITSDKSKTDANSLVVLDTININVINEATVVHAMTETMNNASVSKIHYKDSQHDVDIVKTDFSIHKTAKHNFNINIDKIKIGSNADLNKFEGSLHGTKTDGDILKDEKNTFNTNITNQVNKVEGSLKTCASQICHLLCNFSFIVFFVNNILWNMSVAICWILAPEYFVSIGYTEGEAATILTFGGIGIMTGAVMGGLLGNVKCINRLYLYAFWHFIMALCIICLVEFINQVWELYGIMLLTGIAFGGIMALLITLTVDILGQDALSDAYGFLMLSNGIGSLVGPPIGGALKDLFGDYTTTFYFTSGNVMLGGVIMIAISIKKMCDGSSKKAKIMSEHRKVKRSDINL